MTIFQGIVLGLLQGIAEFLPISSSGHLAVAQHLFQLQDVPLLFDVLLHLATLLAVILYFRNKIWKLLCAFARVIARKPSAQQTQVAQNAQSDNFDGLTGSDSLCRKTIAAVILATFITGFMGILTSKMIPELPVQFICAGFIVTALLLIFSAALDNKKRLNSVQSEKNEGISWKQSLVIGFMQGVGTLPGISRSGSTISGALMSGVNRSDAGEFSFIVSIPAILGAFILEAKDLGEVSSGIGLAPVIAGCIAAFAAGFISLNLLMKLIRKGKLFYFAFYLIPSGILGIIFLH